MLVSCHAMHPCNSVSLTVVMNSVSSQSMCAGIISTSQHMRTHIHTHRGKYMCMRVAHMHSLAHTYAHTPTHPPHTHTHRVTYIHTYMHKHTARNIHECMHTHACTHSKGQTINERCSEQASLCRKELQWWG